jgi:hypothetical protein
VAVGHSLEPDHHGTVGLAPDRNAGPIGHLDDVRCLNDRDAITDVRERGKLAAEEGAEFRFDDRGAAN